jgi:hypothetical protein
MSLLPLGLTVGLHRHGGEEILQVVNGAARFHVNGQNIDVEAGGSVVVAPFTEHGFRILTAQTQLWCVGEIGMGEWVTVIAADGSHSQVEVRSNIMPWHRPPPNGAAMDMPAMMELFATTAAVFDIEPES